MQADTSIDKINPVRENNNVTYKHKINGNHTHIGLNNMPKWVKSKILN